jgi:hypothetical protein
VLKPSVQRHGADKSRMFTLRKRRSLDRSKIATDHEDEVKYWTKHFGISKDDLQGAIEKVGNSAAAVRKELRSGKLARISSTDDK